MRMLLFYAFLALGLLLDGAYLFRMALFCAAVHEAGHVAVYLLCARKLPKLVFSAGGVALKRTAVLCLRDEAFVLAAGPLANFALAAGLWLRAQSKASYGVYFLAAVSVCVGLYNLLPFGVLDGARLLQCVVPVQFLGALLQVQQVLLWLFCIGMPCVAVFAGDSGVACAAAFVASAYLLFQNSFSRR